MGTGGLAGGYSRQRDNRPLAASVGLYAVCQGCRHTQSEYDEARDGESPAGFGGAAARACARV
jgi:hypothetical protein